MYSVRLFFAVVVLDYGYYVFLFPINVMSSIAAYWRNFIVLWFIVKIVSFMCNLVFHCYLLWYRTGWAKIAGFVRISTCVSFSFEM